MKKNIKTYLTHIQELKTKFQQLINENEGLIKKNKQLESTYILPYVVEDLHFLLNQC
jgi:regulator of replication initiation timing